MARTPSNMMPLGTVAPGFTLPDTVSGETLSLSQLKGNQATLVMFICNHCPFVIHLIDELTQLCNEKTSDDFKAIAISANDVDNYPQDHPDLMKELAIEKGFQFPYLYDESQATAQAYAAACTPDFFLFDADLKCVYRGQFDDSRPGDGQAVTGDDLRHAIEATLNNQSIPDDQKPSLGCNIKWKN